MSMFTERDREEWIEWAAGEISSMSVSDNVILYKEALRIGASDRDVRSERWAEYVMMVRKYISGRGSGDPVDKVPGSYPANERRVVSSAVEKILEYLADDLEEEE